MWKTALTLLPVALVGFAPVASATTVKNLEFDTNGVLPSAEPDIEFFNSSAQTEASLYAVNGGFLEQTTFGIGTGNASYGFPDNTVTGGGLDPALATIIEARLSISQIEGLGGVIFQVFDGGNRYTVRFDAGGANVQSNSGNVFVPIASLSSSHTYRIESPGSSDELRFFVDDILELTTTAPSSSLNGFIFGDGQFSAAVNGDANWDFIRVSQVPELPYPVPALGAPAVLILALTLGALGVRRAAIRHQQGRSSTDRQFKQRSRSVRCDTSC